MEEIWIEAEAAATITVPMKTYDDPLASGGKYIGTDDGIGNESSNSPADGIATDASWSPRTASHSSGSTSA